MQVFRQPKETPRHLIYRSGMVSQMGQAAFLFFDDSATAEYWVPFSQVKELHCDGPLPPADPQGLVREDTVQFLIPKWLLKKEKIAYA